MATRILGFGTVLWFALSVSSAAVAQGWTPLGAESPALPATQPRDPAPAPAQAGWSAIGQDPPPAVVQPPAATPEPPPAPAAPAAPSAPPAPAEPPTTPPPSPSPPPATEPPPQPAPPPATGASTAPPPPAPADTIPASLATALAALADAMGQLADGLEQTFGKPDDPTHDPKADDKAKVPMDDLVKDYCHCGSLEPVHDAERQFLIDYVMTVDRSIRGSVSSLNVVLRVVSAARDQLSGARKWEDLANFRHAIDAVKRNIEVSLNLLAEPKPRRAELRSLLVDATGIVRQFKDDYAAFAAAFEAMDVGALDAAVGRLTAGTAAWAPLRARVPPLEREADDIRHRLTPPQNNPNCVPISVSFCGVVDRSNCRPGSTTFDPSTCPEYCRKYPTPRSAVCTVSGYVDMQWTEAPAESYAPAPMTAPTPAAPARKSGGRFR